MSQMSSEGEIKQRSVSKHDSNVPFVIEPMLCSIG